MRKHLSLKYFLLMLLTSILLPINVMAKGDITLEVDKTDLEIGDEVTVTAKLSSDEKLYALTATLNYDRNVFTEIDNKNFISKDDTVDIIYNNSNNKFGIINKSGEISTELFKIRLKVKDKANVGNTSITLTNISSSDGSGKTTYDTSSVNVLVTRDAVDGEVPPLNNS